MSDHPIVRQAATTANLEAVIRAAVSRHGMARDAVIPILSEVNAAFGYIPEEALGLIRRAINTPGEGLFLADSHLFATASFYQMFSLKPVGRRVVRYCKSAPCHVAGGREMVAALQEHLRLKPGETSADGQWTLLETSCLGVCAVGPVFLVDDDIYGNVTPGRIPAILFRYRMIERGER